MATKSTLVKTIETSNHAIALGLFRKYNSKEYPVFYATIAKKKGGDNNSTYIINIYKLFRTEGE